MTISHMDVIKSALIFYYQKKRYEANVEMFKPVDTWQVRVHVLMGKEYKNKNEMILVFYKLKPGELFWYDWNDDFKQGMAKVIADKLLER
jgi:hypothetical protein